MSPANAGDTGLIPGLGRFHMQWAAKSPCTTPTGLTSARTQESQLLKPLCLEPVLGNERSHLTTKSSYSQRKPACSKEDPA